MPMYTFSLRSLRFVKDSPERLDFHVRTGDYLAHLATKLGFIEEAVAKCDTADVSEKERTIARELRHDLRYLDAHYKIVPRDLDDVRDVRPSGNLLAE